ncbi:alpha/beta fold hydrolase [Cupriavidus basilensis]|uniref:alpha/beta fold hydrolase n=1 Tax=Cupriavidus basilensis TaxID=68895 RepID=UPI00346458FB
MTTDIDNEHHADAGVGFRSVWKYLFRTPHKLDWIDVAGIKTRYLEAGSPSAPVVILLHGAAGSLENFLANIAEYARHFRVLAIDMVGAGWTDKPDYPYTPNVYVKHLRGFMDALGIERAALVGNALGSTVAVYFAKRWPERVRRLVLVGIGAIISDQASFDRFMAGVKSRRGNTAEAPTWENVHHVFKNLLLREEDRLDELIALRLEIYQTREMRQAMPHLFATAAADTCLSHDEWRAIETPMLVVAAVDAPNPMFANNARLVGELCPNARVVEIPGCAMWPQYEQAAAFHAASIPFLLDVAAAPPGDL